jgi:hypothetical protein
MSPEELFALPEEQLEEKLRSLTFATAVIEDAEALLANSGFKAKDRFIAAIKHLTPKPASAGASWHRGFANATASKKIRLVAAIIALSQTDKNKMDEEDIPFVKKGKRQ